MGPLVKPLIAAQIPIIAPKQRETRKVESELATVLSRWFSRQFGRGPQQIQATMTDDMIVIRQQGTLSPAEQRLAESEDGSDLVQRYRRRLIGVFRDELIAIVEERTARRVVELFSDTSSSGDHVDVFMLERRAEAD